MKSEVNSIESWVSAPYTRGTPGHPARQPGHCHTPTLKSMLSNTVQRRQAPAISPDERSGLASSPLMERRTGDALRPQEAAPDSHIAMTEPLFGEWRCSSTRAHARLARSTLQLSLRKASSLRLGAGVRARCGNRTRRSDSCGSLESCHCVRLRPPGGERFRCCELSERRRHWRWRLVRGTDGLHTKTCERQWVTLGRCRGAGARRRQSRRWPATRPGSGSRPIPGCRRPAGSGRAG
jgi:hypothetical protein